MIGDNIKKLRLQANETQETFAQKLGVSRQSVSHWENNKALPSTELLLTISKLYQIPLSSLVGETTETLAEPIPSSKRIENLKIYFSYLPVTGAFVSFFTICILIMKGYSGKDLYSHLYVLTPLLAHLAIYFLMKTVCPEMRLNKGLLFGSYLFVLFMQAIFYVA